MDADQEPKFPIKIDAAIKVPYLSKWFNRKSHFIIDNVSDYIQPGKNSAEYDTDIFMGLRSVLYEHERKNLRIDVTSDVGVKWHTISPDPYARLYLTQARNLNSWLFTPRQEFKWSNRGGITETTGMSWRRPVGKSYTFDSNTQAQWFLDSGWYFGQVFALKTPIGHKATGTFELSASAEDRSDAVERVTLEFEYKRLTFRNWIVIEFAPGLAATREFNYRPRPCFLIMAEIFFGKELTQSDL